MPELEAEIVTAVEALTAEVVIVNAPDVAPDGTVMLAGTEAALGLELVSVTTIPDEAAGTLRVTRLEVVTAPPVTELELRVMPDKASAQYNGEPAPPNS
jgi:hypothetical protein